MRKCRTCGESKDLLKFYKHPFGRNGYDSKCIECSKKYNKDRYINLSSSVKDGWKRIRRIRLRNFRKKAIIHYGGKCECCGEKRYEFLCIDHINGNGNKHRKELGSRSIGEWLNKNNYPKGFQVLCWNCNSAKHIFGKCPHQK